MRFKVTSTEVSACLVALISLGTETGAVVLSITTPMKITTKVAKMRKAHFHGFRFLGCLCIFYLVWYSKLLFFTIASKSFSVILV